jgi:hypothetical protein
MPVVPGALWSALGDMRARRTKARYGDAVGADGLVRLLAYGALLSPRVLAGRGMDGVDCEGACVVPGKRLAFRVRRPAYATLLPLAQESESDRWLDSEMAHAELDQSADRKGADAFAAVEPPRADAPPEAEGYLYRMSSQQLDELANREGGYSLQRVRVRMLEPRAPSLRAAGAPELPVTRLSSLREVEALAFIGTAWDLLPVDGFPSARYLAKVQTGARARGLSERYQDWLCAHPTRKEQRMAAAAGSAAPAARNGATPTEWLTRALAGGSLLWLAFASFLNY